MPTTFPFNPSTFGKICSRAFWTWNEHRLAILAGPRDFSKTHCISHSHSVLRLETDLLASGSTVSSSTIV